MSFQKLITRFKKISNLEIKITIPVRFILVLPLTGYVLWEFFWYTKVGLGFIKWHTHLAPYFYVLLLLLLGFIKRSFSETRTKITLFISAVFFSFLLIEVYCLFTYTYKTQTEKDSGIYKSPYLPFESWYHLYTTREKEHWLKKPEFAYWRPTNRLGMADNEWSVVKQKNETKIVAIGDSFTEGDGAAFDSNYVAFLKQKLANTYTVMNAGICGSDPFNNYVVFRDIILPYKPDLIIQSIGTNDIITDIGLRGGLERFQSDGTLKYSPAPWWEPLYAISYVSRIFFQLAGYNELLIKNELPVAKQAQLNAVVIDLFKRYSAICRTNNIKLCVVLRPDKYELINQRYSYNFTPIITQLKIDTTLTVLNLLPQYTTYLQLHHIKPENCYWTIDGHHNATGYYMMAQCVFQSLFQTPKQLLTY
jgi:lysophospholipase L1-like esterase